MFSAQAGCEFESGNAEGGLLYLMESDAQNNRRASCFSIQSGRLLSWVVLPPGARPLYWHGMAGEKLVIVTESEVALWTDGQCAAKTMLSVSLSIVSSCNNRAESSLPAPIATAIL